MVEPPTVPSQPARAPDPARDAALDSLFEGLPLTLLEQAQKMATLGQLVSGLAHELNNPLSAILAFSQLMQRDERLPPDVHRDADLLMQEADRTRRIVQTLLDFARQPRPERQPSAIGELVERALDLHAYALATGRIEVVREIPDDLPVIEVDSSQILQVLLNLLANAIYAMRETGTGGTLTVTARVATRSDAHGEHIRLSVTDTGPGVPPDVRPRMFEPFFTTREPEEGSGLGLSVSHRIVVSHGGRLWYEPAADGLTSFVMELPARSPVRSAAGHPGGAAPEASSAQRRVGHVLAVDDEPSIRALLRRALERAGHDVAVAGSGQEGLEMVASRTPDVMLVDHRMSGMDGVECCRTAFERWPELRARTVIMSGDGQNPTLHEFAARHGLRVLSKPFDVATVGRVVDEILRNGTTAVAAS